MCDEENRRLLRSKGLVVYLKTSIEDQLKRLSKAKNRPLLQAQDKTQRLRDLAHVRNPLYDDTADLVFNTCSLSVYQSAKALSKIILEQVDPLKPEKPNADR